MTLSLLLVGTSGQGGVWCREFLPPNVADGTVDVVGAVDIDEDALANAREHLDVDRDRCFTDPERAFAAVEADAVAITTPPGVREELIGHAIDHGMDVITEKPLAEDLETAIRIVERVEDAGLKVGVTMSHRFRRDVTTLRRELRSGDHGAVDHIYSRYVINARSRGVWGNVRNYDWEHHPLLLEGSIHHLDLLADLADERVETVFCHTWNPPYSEFAGDPNGTVTMITEEGTSIVYEGLNTAATTLNGWHSEHIRANASDTTLVLDDAELRAFPYDPDDEGIIGGKRIEDGANLHLAEQEKWGNTWLVEQFAEWCGGGESMPTDARSNLRSMVLVFAAIESAETGRSVDVDRFLEPYGTPDY